MIDLKSQIIKPTLNLEDIKVVASAEGWKLTDLHSLHFFLNRNFKYRRAIKITEQSGSDLTDYQVLIELNSTNFDFSHAQTNGEDIRFTDTDSNLSSYWIEEWDALNETAKIWVEVPSIPANGTVEIYCYYGNSEITSVSDGDAVFELFDDFEGTSLDTNKWNSYQTYSGGSIAVENSYVKLDAYLITSKNYQITDGIIETKVKIISKEGSMFARSTNNTGNQWISSYGLHSGDFGAGNTWNLAITQDDERQFTDTTQAILNEWLLLRFTLNGNSLKGERFKYADMSSNGGPVEGTLTKYSSGYIGLRVDGTGDGDRIAYYDWILVRKYASPSPTVEIGEEETA